MIRSHKGSYTQTAVMFSFSNVNDIYIRSRLYISQVTDCLCEKAVSSLRRKEAGTCEPRNVEKRTDRCDIILSVL